MSMCSVAQIASNLSVESRNSAVSDPPKSLKCQLVKTRFCKHFARGFCRYEDTCAYAHGLQELKSRPNLVKTKICINRLAGACSEGSACKYAHDRSEVRSAYSDSSASTTKASSLGASAFTSLTVPSLASSQTPQASRLTQQMLKSQEVATLADLSRQQASLQAAQQAARRAERLQAWDTSSHASYSQAMSNLSQGVPPPPMPPMQSRQLQPQRLQPSLREQMLELCRDLGSNPEKASLAASMVELLLNNETLEDMPQVVNLPTKRWGSLANAAMRADRKERLTEGSALLAYDRCGSMSFEVGQIVSLILLRDMAWSALFPDLSRRCSRQIALQLTSQLSGVMARQPEVMAPQPQVQTQRVMRSPPGLRNGQESFSMPSCQVRSIGTDIRVVGA